MSLCFIWKKRSESWCVPTRRATKKRILLQFVFLVFALISRSSPRCWCEIFVWSRCIPRKVSFFFPTCRRRKVNLCLTRNNYSPTFIIKSISNKDQSFCCSFLNGFQTVIAAIFFFPNHKYCYHRLLSVGSQRANNISSSEKKNKLTAFCCLFSSFNRKLSQITKVASLKYADTSECNLKW